MEHVVFWVWARTSLNKNFLPDLTYLLNNFSKILFGYSALVRIFILEQLASIKFQIGDILNNFNRLKPIGNYIRNFKL